MKTKLIQTKDYLFLIDEEAEIKEGDTVYEDISGIFSPYEKGDIVENPKKIIAYYPLTKEAKELGGLPQLPNPFREDEFSKYYRIVFDYVNSGLRNFGAMMALYKLKEIAQSKQFSLDDMKKAIQMAKGLDIKSGVWYKCDAFSEEEIIQSLSTQKMPSEFIPKYDRIRLPKGDDGWEDVHHLKTITNLEGKQELVGTYIY